jgi:hypothetical protein
MAACQRLARALLLPLLLIVCQAGGARAAESFSFVFDDFVSPIFEAHKLKFAFKTQPKPEFRLVIGEVKVYGETWRDVRLECPTMRMERHLIRCERGLLTVIDSVPVRFSYSSKDQSFELALLPESGEEWTAQANFGGGRAEATIGVQNGLFRRLGRWLPTFGIELGEGRVTGQIRLSGSEQAKTASMFLAATGIDFSDAKGERAAQGVNGVFYFEASEVAPMDWQWKGALEWADGSVFWKPLFLTAGHSFAAAGRANQKRIDVDDMNLVVAGVGRTQGKLSFNLTDNSLTDASVSARGLDLTGLHRLVLRPFLQGGDFADLEIAGTADLGIEYRQQQLESIDFRLNDVSAFDSQVRFVLGGFSADLAWHRTERRESLIKIESAVIGRLPFKQVDIPLYSEGMRFGVGKVRLPMFDGAFVLDGAQAELIDNAWKWRLGGEISGVSMEQVSLQLGYPKMAGSFSAKLPSVAYADRVLRVDGGLNFVVFDGQVELTELVVDDPLGKAPVLRGGLRMRNLDLGKITGTFGFGNVEGKIDADVSGLRMVNWRPDRFDARVGSSPGDYPKRISNRALRNIAALSGADFTARLQRFFVGFIETFRYDKLGLACRLRDGVCDLDGAEPHGEGFYILKGAGIPEVNLVGYNRRVRWEDLLQRVNRVSANNVKPVVR